MNEQKHLSAPAGDQRKPYEPPAIEQSAGFERVMLSCALVPDDEDCVMGEAFSSGGP
jgi:hypothetical protein